MKETNKKIYKKQMIPEYVGNPLIEVLPDILSEEEAIEILVREPDYNEKERQLEAKYRFHCIQRLFQYFQPIDYHLDIEQRISKCIRQGYLNRNPLKREYANILEQGYVAHQENRGFESIKGYKPTAFGFTIIGISGVGKSTAIERVLSLYQQTIQHVSYKGKPLYMTQLVWIKIDCPYDGSLKGLCYQFFESLDRALGTEYFKKYARAGYTVDALLVYMTQLANLYCLGVLIIDEIQHLSLAKGGGSEKMLNFFVTLVNTIGVPVVLIGTMKALSILQSEFRQARRGSGQGDLIWDRMMNDFSWNIMIESMWKYQWTSSKVLLTKKLKDIIYDESQGIIDIAVKIYVMVQVRAISIRAETFTEEDVKQVAKEKLKLVRNMLTALKSGDKKRIEKYEDIRPINIDDYISAQKIILSNSVYERNNEKRINIEEKSILKLLELGVKPNKAKVLVGRIMAKLSGNPDVKEIVKQAFILAINDEQIKVVDNNKELDINCKEKYNSLKTSGVIADIDEDF